MDAKARSELYAIRRELTAIIREMENIISGIRSDFVGIGADKCAASLERELQNYYTAQRKLANLDTKTVTESFAKAHNMV